MSDSPTNPFTEEKDDSDIVEEKTQCVNPFSQNENDAESNEGPQFDDETDKDSDDWEKSCHERSMHKNKRKSKPNKIQKCVIYLQESFSKKPKPNEKEGSYKYISRKITKINALYLLTGAATLLIGVIFLAISVAYGIIQKTRRMPSPALTALITLGSMLSISAIFVMTLCLTFIWYIHRQNKLLTKSKSKKNNTESPSTITEYSIICNINTTAKIQILATSIIFSISLISTIVSMTTSAAFSFLQSLFHKQTVAVSIILSLTITCVAALLLSAGFIIIREINQYEGIPSTNQQTTAREKKKKNILTNLKQSSIAYSIIGPSLIVSHIPVLASLLAVGLQNHSKTKIVLQSTLVLILSVISIPSILLTLLGSISLGIFNKYYDDGIKNNKSSEQTTDNEGSTPKKSKDKRVYMVESMQKVAIIFAILGTALAASGIIFLAGSIAQATVSRLTNPAKISLFLFLSYIAISLIVSGISSVIIGCTNTLSCDMYYGGTPGGGRYTYNAFEAQETESLLPQDTKSECLDNNP